MKNKKAIILLFIANSISGISQGISMIAIPWYFALKEESQSFFLIYIITNLIALMWVPYSGTFVDRYNRKNIFLITTLLSGLILTVVAAYGFQQGGLSVLMVGFVFMFTFFNYNIHYPNLYAFVQEISEPERYNSISSYIEIQGQATNMFAGASAAFLLEGSTDGIFNLIGVELHTGLKFEAWKIHEIFALDALTYFFGFVFIYFIRYVALKKRNVEVGSIRERLKTGIRYLIKNSKIFIFGISSHSVFAAAIVTTIALAPIYVKNHLMESGDVFASGKMSFSIGALLAGLTIRFVFKRINIPASIILMTTLSMIAYFVLSVSGLDLIFFGMFFLMGICNAGVRVQRVTYLFQHVPNQVYGRAMSIFTQINTTFRVIFLSLFSLTFFQADHGIVYSFGVLSLFLLLTLFVLLWNYGSLKK